MKKNWRIIIVMALGCAFLTTGCSAAYRVAFDVKVNETAVGMHLSSGENGSAMGLEITSQKAFGQDGIGENDGTGVRDGIGENVGTGDRNGTGENVGIRDKGMTASEGERDALIPPDVREAAETLYSFQKNYANGTALLNLIPVEMVRQVYDNYEELLRAGIPQAPVLLREYAVTETVYLDYDTDCSIVWDKQTGDVRIEKTEVAEREAFREKAHKV